MSQRSNKQARYLNYPLVPNVRNSNERYRLNNNVRVYLNE